MKQILGISLSIVALAALFLWLKPVETGLQPAQIEESGAKSTLQADKSSQSPVAKRRSASAVASNVSGHLGRTVDQLRAASQGQPFDRQTYTNTNPLVRIDQSGRIQLYLKVAQVDAATLSDVENNGFEVELTNEKLGIVQGWAHFDDITALAQLDVVDQVNPPRYPRVMSGSVVTEGDTLHFANELRAAGLNGEGMKIGVISDGATDRADSIATGDLPSDIATYGTCTKRVEDRTECLSVWTCNEGTAIAEIIHDMAPSASIAVGAVSTSLEFIQRVDDLTNDFGADVIIDDLGFLSAPYFEDGDIAQAVAAVTDSVIYVSSAGNSRDSHFEDDYLSTQANTLGDTYDLHDFISSVSEDTSMNISMAVDSYVVAFMQWNDEMGASANDYDLLLTNNDDDTLLSASRIEQSGTQDPIEALCYHNNTGGFQSRKLLVNKSSGEDRYFEIYAFGPNITNQYVTSTGSVFGHSAVPSIISVAAANSTSPNATTFYSSRGPSRIDYPERQNRLKPDITGIDEVSVTGTGGFPSTFYGTSAAAPHVAALAAQLKQLSPGSSPAVIKNVLMLTADDLHFSGFDNQAGAGRANGSAARTYFLNNTSDDSDGDGIVDMEDAFPNDASETLDTDGDSIGNGTDTDDDGDGVADVDDAAPLDASVTSPVTNNEPGEPAGTNTAHAYLMTNSNSQNVSEVHIVNTSSTALNFTGSLYNGDGEQLGSANTSLNGTATNSNGRLVLTASDLEVLFGVEAWQGPALLSISSSDAFEVMIRLTSPSGLVSNTNCVKEDSVANIEGFDSDNLSYIRFINTSSTTLSNISGTLYSSTGEVIGTSGATLIESLAPNAATWLNRSEISSLVADTWNGTAQLDIADQNGLKLLNLNFVNNETFFNFSCYDGVTEDQVQTTCSDPRPEACTQEIDYVCAERQDGESSTEWATYSNGCSACSDTLVTRHFPGQCEDRLTGN